MLWLPLDKTAAMPLTQQIYDQIRTKILRRELSPGERLPSTRRCAQELQVSRNVVIYAYEQLLAEGYLEGRVGSGTYVADDIALEAYQEYTPVTNARRISAAPAPAAANSIDFQTGIPDLSQFPRKIWAKLLRDACLDAPATIFNYPPVEGLAELRQTLVTWLLTTKGIRCHADQILIVSGSAQGLALLFQLVATPARHFLIEDPVYAWIQHLLNALQYTFDPVPVDDKGMQTVNLAAAPALSGIIVTPSHQFPLGCVLPIQRRVRLIEYARAHQTLIIENDYDSEFRYVGAPISSLHALAPEEVLHVGTFSESLYPSVRLGYMVVPERFIAPCRRLKAALGLSTSALRQLALAAFIAQGHFERHLHKMKKLYREKRQTLITHLRQVFGETVTITGDSTGLYVVAEFTAQEFTPALLEELVAAEVRVSPVEAHAIVKGRHRNKIILGYGNLSLTAIATGVARLAQVLRK
jgi:GntR family transcriptional regulator / MocR family aminotransferase